MSFSIIPIIVHFHLMYYTKHTHTHTLSLSLTHTTSQSLSLSHTHTHTHIHMQAHTHTHTHTMEENTKAWHFSFQQSLCSTWDAQQLHLKTFFASPSFDRDEGEWWEGEGQGDQQPYILLFPGCGSNEGWG